MENKEVNFVGMSINGFVMLPVFFVLLAISIYLFVMGIDTSDALSVTGSVLFVLDLILLAGFVQIEPNEARVMMFFGKYKGTFKKVGFHWVNPFITTKKLSLRARNLNAAPIKVNDKGQSCDDWFGVGVALERYLQSDFRNRFANYG